MRAKLQQLANWIDALNIKERAGFLIAIIIAIFLVWDQILLTPLESKGKLLQIQVKKQNKDLARVREQQTQVIERSVRDPNEQNNKEILALNKAMVSLDARLREMTVDLINPQQMATVLEEVLTRETDLHLISVKSLPPQPLTEVKDKASRRDKRSKSTLPGVYKHALQIEFQGSYLSTLQYMQALEELERRFYWGSIDFEVEEYPRARVIITVNTLSLNEAWIGV